MLIALALIGVLGVQEPAAPVHSLCDLSQSFTFYMDGRFARQYLDGEGRDARNWGTLHKAELSNVNLLVLTAGEEAIPFAPESVEHVAAYVAADGGLLVMADARPDERVVPVSALLSRFGAQLDGANARAPARGLGALEGVEITYRGGRVLDLTEDWQPLVLDADSRPILARRGHVLVGSRGLFGSRPDASDPINAAWITPLLLAAAQGKAVDPDKPAPRLWAELEREIGPLTLEFHEGTEPFADAISAEFAGVRPHLVALTGVEPSPGMIKRLLILPTGGGGFSSGARIAIGAFWGNYPERRYPMVELIAHEAGHSWVLPHPEPLWNEPIATYLGIKTGERLEMPEAQQTLQKAIERARQHDPQLDQIDPQSTDAPRDLVWGKSYFVFEELERLHGPGALALYFRTKRARVPADHPQYTMDDCVAVWSAAVDDDLFAWFRGLGFDVDRERVTLDDEGR
jgi:hypothetical protein